MLKWQLNYVKGEFHDLGNGLLSRARRVFRVDEFFGPIMIDYEWDQKGASSIFTASDHIF